MSEHTKCRCGGTPALEFEDLEMLHTMRRVRCLACDVGTRWFLEGEPAWRSWERGELV